MAKQEAERRRDAFVSEVVNELTNIIVEINRLNKDKEIDHSEEQKELKIRGNAILSVVNRATQQHARWGSYKSAFWRGAGLMGLATLPFYGAYWALGQNELGTALGLTVVTALMGMTGYNMGISQEWRHDRKEPSLDFLRDIYKRIGLELERRKIRVPAHKDGHIYLIEDLLKLPKTASIPSCVIREVQRSLRNRVRKQTQQ